MGISTGKLKLYPNDGLKYCAKKECNNMITAPGCHKHSSSGAIRPSDGAVTVNINAEFNLSSIWWQLTPWLTAFQGISSLSIVMVWSIVQSTLPLPLLSTPSLVAQIGVYLTCHWLCMQRKIFLHSQCRTSISDYPSMKPSPWHDSCCTKCL